MPAAAREDRALSGEGRVEVGLIIGAHGIRGAVKIRCFTEDPKTIATLGPIEGPDRRSYVLKILSASKGQALAMIEGVSDRNAAEALKGTKLFAGKSRLPQPGKGEFFQTDLIGLDVVDPAGANRGTVKAVLNYGAGDVLEIQSAPGTEPRLIPFDDAYVTQVDLSGKRLVIDFPVETEAEDGPK